MTVGTARGGIPVPRIGSSVAGSSVQKEEERVDGAGEEHVASHGQSHPGHCTRGPGHLQRTEPVTVSCPGCSSSLQAAQAGGWAPVAELRLPRLTGGPRLSLPLSPPAPASNSKCCCSYPIRSFFLSLPMRLAYCAYFVESQPPVPRYATYSYAEAHPETEPGS